MPDFIGYSSKISLIQSYRFLSVWCPFWCPRSRVVNEQALYKKQLDRDLDILDGLIATEVQGETVEQFSGEQPEAKERAIEETRGIPTGVAFDIHSQIERRRAKQTAEEEKSKAETFVRQGSAGQNRRSRNAQRHHARNHRSLR